MEIGEALELASSSGNTIIQDSLVRQHSFSTTALTSHIPPVTSTAAMAMANPWSAAAAWLTNQEEASKDVKKELEKTIKDKCTAKGVELPKVEYKPPSKPQRRPPESKEVIQKRRERNKTAAMKCRSKKKKELERFTRKIEKEESIMESLLEVIKKLKTEANDLKGCLSSHKCILPGAVTAMQTAPFTDSAHNFDSTQLVSNLLHSTLAEQAPGHDSSSSEFDVGWSMCFH